MFSVKLSNEKINAWNFLDFINKVIQGETIKIIKAIINSEDILFLIKLLEPSLLEPKDPLKDEINCPTLFLFLFSINFYG